LRELFQRSQAMEKGAALRGVREFLERIHAVMNALDVLSLTTIAAVHGVDIWRRVRVGSRLRHHYCGPHGAILLPGIAAGTDSWIRWDSASEAGFGQCGGARSAAHRRSFNVMKAQQIGLVSQIAAEGEALRVARATASQVGKFDRRTAAAAKEFMKPIPYEELKREIDIFCDLYSHPAVEEGLRKFVENEGVQPYLP